MKKQKNKTNVWVAIGVLAAVVLLLWWLFFGTLLEEDTSDDISPVTIEQVN